ncbi:MAG: low molecular weight phosphotyrosine protein phosphatase [Actinomycetota bacterium]|nr:low molecular weight phosphotyrosine protein phosphatase [Actinomycetota bacterium]
MVRVLFVCLGNICRSPICQGLFEEEVRRAGMSGEIAADSAGTHGFYHAGEMPDPRAQESVRRRGIDISAQRVRLLEREDCERFDYVLTMDDQNYERVVALCRGAGTKTVVRPFLDFAPDRPEREVSDPYGGGPEGFELAMDLAEAASEGLLKDIQERHLRMRHGR